MAAAARVNIFAMQQRRVVLVTGGARRLGRTVVLRLAASGWDVCIHYNGSHDDAVQTGRDASAAGAATALVQADLADEANCVGLFGKALDAFGRIDAVVNNASLFEYDDASSVSHASMERHWKANTFPAIALARDLAAHAEARSITGCVVNLLDQKLWNLNADYFSYTLSKAALETATQLLARSLAPHVRVAGVAPGVTLPSGPMNDDEYRKAARMTPLGRSSSPQDIAGAVQYLLDAEAVTGTTLLVDGGQHLSSQSRDVMFLAGDDLDGRR
jgi:NAD(P)-dependent dehydrogenase (short-subunit alcohol dehydrogenase family)